MKNSKLFSGGSIEMILIVSEGARGRCSTRDRDGKWSSWALSSSVSDGDDTSVSLSVDSSHWAGLPQFASSQGDRIHTTCSRI